MVSPTSFVGSFWSPLLRRQLNHFADLGPSTQVVRLILSGSWGAFHPGENSQMATRTWVAAAAPLHLGWRVEVGAGPKLGLGLVSPRLCCTHSTTEAGVSCCWQR